MGDFDDVRPIRAPKPAARAPLGVAFGKESLRAAYRWQDMIYNQDRRKWERFRDWSCGIIGAQAVLNLALTAALILGWAFG